MSAEATPCPKCGSTHRDYGRLTGVLFRSGTNVLDSAFSIGDVVIAIACLRCGNIELVLDRVPRDHAKCMER
jgi:hypothetical protein